MINHLSYKLVVKIITVFLMLMPAFGYSLGIGDIKLYSHLNQSLNADILLEDSSYGRADDFKVNLIPLDDSDQSAGYFLSKIKIRIGMGSDGLTLLTLSSVDTINEPILNFTVQITYSKGVLSRDFSLLLEPIETGAAISHPASTKEHLTKNIAFKSNNSPLYNKRSLLLSKNKDSLEEISARTPINISIKENNIREKEIQTNQLETIIPPNKDDISGNNTSHTQSVQPKVLTGNNPVIEKSPDTAKAPLDVSINTAPAGDDLEIYYAVGFGLVIALLVVYLYKFFSSKRKEKELTATFNPESDSYADDSNEIDNKNNIYLEKTHKKELIESSDDISFHGATNVDIDLLSELDVYLSHHLYDQAEELIRHGIDDNPNNNDYKLKLLEVFFADGNIESFNHYAHELAESSCYSDVEFWYQVVEMGVKICPDSNLFLLNDSL